MYSNLSQYLALAKALTEINSGSISGAYAQWCPGAGLCEPYKSLPTPDFLWFSDSIGPTLSQRMGFLLSARLPGHNRSQFYLRSTSIILHLSSPLSYYSFSALYLQDLCCLTNLVLLFHAKHCFPNRVLHLLALDQICSLYRIRAMLCRTGAEHQVRIIEP